MAKRWVYRRPATRRKARKVLPPGIVGTITIDVLEGASTVRATRTLTVGDLEQVQTVTLTGPEIASFASWSDVRIRVTKNNQAVSVSRVAMNGVTVGTSTSTLSPATAVATFSAPASLFALTVPQTTATITFSAPAPVVARTIPAASVTITTSAPNAVVARTIPAATAAVTFSAPAPLLALTLPAGTATATFSAPVQTLSAVVTLSAATAVATFSAPAPRTNITAIASTAVITFSNPPPSAVLSPITLTAATALATFSAPTGTLAPSVTLASQTATVTLSAPSTTLTASVTITSSTATASFSAPIAAFAPGAVTIAATTALVTFSAGASALLLFPVLSGNGWAFGQQTPTGSGVGASWQHWRTSVGVPVVTASDADWGYALVAPGVPAYGPVADTGNTLPKTFAVARDQYQTGTGSVSISMRGAATRFDMFDDEVVGPAWTSYGGPVDHAWRYVQLKMETP